MVEVIVELIIMLFLFFDYCKFLYEREKFIVILIFFMDIIVNILLKDFERVFIEKIFLELVYKKILFLK